jgi:molybdopterin-guanine dinucleotide biosynthesis protein A
MLPTQRNLVGGIVLAGGESRRMGRDKALVEWRGAPLIRHSVDAIRHVAAETVIVAASTDSYSVAGATTVADAFPGEGPVGGICTGIQSLHASIFVVVACDMPAIQLALLRLLIDSLTETEEVEAVAVLDDATGMVQPLCAVYRSESLPKLLNFMAEGRRSARAAIESLKLRLLNTEDVLAADPQRLSFLNINTEQELLNLDAQWSLSQQRLP